MKKLFIGAALLFMSNLALADYMPKIECEGGPFNYTEIEFNEVLEHGQVFIDKMYVSESIEGYRVYLTTGTSSHAEHTISISYKNSLLSPEVRAVGHSRFAQVFVGETEVRCMKRSR